MAVTTLPSTSLVKQLRRDYQQFTFSRGDDFHWSPATNQIYYRQTTSADDRLSLLHELAHAELNHQTFDLAITLLDMERAAWERVITTLAARYTPNIAPDHVEDVAQTALDYYRDWLHQRSICPHCDAVGVEVSPHYYRCLTCRGTWHVNDARACALRRYKDTN